ncbi:MAG TPA: hypothetical protein VEX18_02085, partial [Polyangiaceae bacterium]|nr:hypothetical protein [Polyangiaceae bacterium]
AFGARESPALSSGTFVGSEVRPEGTAADWTATSRAALGLSHHASTIVTATVPSNAMNQR